MAVSTPIRRFATMIKAPGVITGAPKSITASKSLTRTAHAGRLVTVNAAAGLTLTLPASKGLGDVYEIIVGTTITSNTIVVQVANSTDVMTNGVLVNDIGDTSAATADYWPTASTSDTITLTASTGYGKQGDVLVFTDFKSGSWMINGFIQGVTDPSTPFSAAV